jgi:hypothetical protein
MSTVPACPDDGQVADELECSSSTISGLEKESTLRRLESVLMYTLKAPSWKPWIRFTGTLGLVLIAEAYTRTHGG